MRLILVDSKPDLCEAWQARLPEVDVRCGRFEDVTDADAFATAGNSFGLMDGGVDLAVARFAPGIEAQVQHEIRTVRHGELPVGQCMVVPMRQGGYRWLLYAPTMRVPMSIAGTDNVYVAMWAILLRAHGLVDSLAVPGLGTATGRVPPAEAARQMGLAWHNFNHVPDRYDWPTAYSRHAYITVGLV